MKLIGISGTNGSGKDTIGQYLADQHKWLFVSVTDMLREECRRRGLAIERENLRTISAEWRREGGLGVLVDKAVELFGETSEDYAGLAVASLRNPGEVDRVHELGGVVVWVDADARIRYDRIQSVSRGRGSEDTKTFAEFLAEQEAEMQSSGDAATLNMSTVRDKADEQLLNEGTPEQLKDEIAMIVESFSV
ncbi:MAG: hypothetical protein QG629_452 [Patescibacteria group bacterium]|nr:AAA family ATPase [Candidatus Saccharibacteria bacterium]MDQ5963370.1 hypothetical protein [Patescibacteria group bacterium]